jgi:hypothetical protein
MPLKSLQDPESDIVIYATHTVATPLGASVFVCVCFTHWLDFIHLLLEVQLENDRSQSLPVPRDGTHLNNTYILVTDARKI